MALSSSTEPSGISTRRARRDRILIAGLGNLLLRDDGVGVHVVKELGSAQLPRGVLAVEVGTAPLDALHLLEWADEVHAVDAVAGGGPPGSIYRLELADIVDGRPVSLHDVGLRAVCRLLPPAQRPRVTVWGVEPALIEYGLELSEAVRSAVPELVWILMAAARSGIRP